MKYWKFAINSRFVNLLWLLSRTASTLANTNDNNTNNDRSEYAQTQGLVQTTNDLNLQFKPLQCVYIASSEKQWPPFEFRWCGDDDEDADNGGSGGSEHRRRYWRSPYAIHEPNWCKRRNRCCPFDSWLVRHGSHIRSKHFTFVCSFVL